MLLSFVPSYTIIVGAFGSIIPQLQHHFPALFHQPSSMADFDWSFFQAC
jgi:hypothetical protein